MASSTNIKDMKNPSIILYKPGDAKLEDRPMPEIQDPHDVLVRIAFVGVCGSDVSILRSPSFHYHLPLSSKAERSIGTMSVPKPKTHALPGALLPPRRHQQNGRPLRGPHHGPRSLRHHRRRRPLRDLRLRRRPRRHRARPTLPLLPPLQVWNLPPVQKHAVRIHHLRYRQKKYNSLTTPASQPTPAPQSHQAPSPSTTASRRTSSTACRPRSPSRKPWSSSPPA